MATPGSRPGAGLDLPTGRHIHIPSGITNQPVHYFIPDPFRNLLVRCEGAPVDSGPDEVEKLHACAILHLAARRGYAGVVDAKQNGLLFDILWQPPQAGTVAELAAIAARVGKGSQEPRQQIVFTGSNVASEAIHVYAPHEAVPMLMDMLSDGIAYEASGVSVVDRVAVLGYYCVHAHPFKDGNGRWTRALTLAVERRSLMKSIAAMSFQTVCPRALAEVVWPETRVRGLRTYLEACNAYTERLLATYYQSPVFDSINGVNDALRRAARNTAKYRALSRLVFVERKLDIAETKQLLGVSSRVVEGLFQTLGGCGLRETPGGLSVDSLLKEVDGYADATASFCMSNLRAGQ